MGKARLTIGELSRRTGVPVKTLRFYSDEGLLPPAGRSASRYRLYGEDALVRVELVRTLREAGLALDSIKKIIRREASLAEALRLRLAAVEAHVRSLQQVSAALRAALRGHEEPNEDDIRRLCAVTRLSNDERKAAIETFYERVSEGIPIDEQWRKRMIEASAPKLPDDPTPAQLDAWIELSEMIADPKFIESLRRNAKEVWGKFDMNAMRIASDACQAKARDAIARGVPPDSAEAAAVVEAYARALAEAGKKPFDEKFRDGMRERFERQDPRASRYWELVAVMNGTPSATSPIAATPAAIKEWEWVKAAVAHAFARRCTRNM